VAEWSQLTHQVTDRSLSLRLGDQVIASVAVVLGGQVVVQHCCPSVAGGMAPGPSPI
jgi:hypothetical protein